MNNSPEETNSNSSPIQTLENNKSTILFPNIPPIENYSSITLQNKTENSFLNSNSINNNINNSTTISNSNNSKIIYNTGRWSEEEHSKFIDGILEYGNEWKKVQNLIGTRSSTQARSHAQKFFLRLKKNFNLESDILSENNSTAVSPISNSSSNNKNNENGIKNFFELIYKNKKDKKLKNEKLTLEQKKKIINLVTKVYLHENNENVSNKNNNNNNFENIKKNFINDDDYNKNSMIKIKINENDDCKIIENNKNNNINENKINNINNNYYNKTKKIFDIKKDKNKKFYNNKKFEKKMSFDYVCHYENLIKNDKNNSDDDLYLLGKKKKINNNNSESNNVNNRQRFNSVNIYHNYELGSETNPFVINFDGFGGDIYDTNNNINHINNNSKYIIEEEDEEENILNPNNNLIHEKVFDNFKI